MRKVCKLMKKQETYVGNLFIFSSPSFFLLWLISNTGYLLRFSSWKKIRPAIPLIVNSKRTIQQILVLFQLKNPRCSLIHFQEYLKYLLSFILPQKVLSNWKHILRNLCRLLTNIFSACINKSFLTKLPEILTFCEKVSSDIMIHITKNMRFGADHCKESSHIHTILII